MIESYNVKFSINRKCNCQDNSVAESFFKILKTKLIYGNKRMSKKQMQLEVFEYLEIRCNKNNSRLNYLTI